MASEILLKVIPSKSRKPHIYEVFSILIEVFPKKTLLASLTGRLGANSLHCATKSDIVG